MDNIEIRRLLSSHLQTKSTFVGVFAADTLPRRPRPFKPCAYVVNTDVESGPGEHWVCIYFPKNGPVEYFDSYGCKPRRLHKKIMKNHRIVSSKIRLQSNLSTTCGQHVIHYILKRCMGNSMTNILSIFNKKHLITNDQYVVNHVNRTFGTNTSILDKQFFRQQIHQVLM